MLEISKSPYIQLTNICFAYPKSKPLIQGLSRSFFKEETTALMGPNGSGKTTLGKLISGLLTPSHGEIILGNDSVLSMSLGEIGQKVGYLFQEPQRQLFAPFVVEELRFILELKGFSPHQIKKKVEETLTLFDLYHLKERSTFTLSRGEKQRLALAGILVNDPPFLVLDEPTTGLDMIRRQHLGHLMNTLKKQKIGFLVITHDDDFANNNADRIITMEGGTIATDEYFRSSK